MCAVELCSDFVFFYALRQNLRREYFGVILGTIAEEFHVRIVPTAAQVIGNAVYDHKVIIRVVDAAARSQIGRRLDRVENRLNQAIAPATLFIDNPTDRAQVENARLFRREDPTGLIISWLPQPADIPAALKLEKEMEL